MEKINENINRFLPYGESLKTILHHPTIKKNNIKDLLRLKGVYINDDDDDTTFPLLLTSLLSPYEFGFLKEKLSSREERVKTITRKLEWNSGISLIQAVPDNFNIQEVVKTAFPKYKVIGTPNFSMVDKNPNFIQLNFKCETDDYGKAWFRSKNEFEGQVTLEKIETEDKKVQLQIVHTSPETTEISNKVVKHLESHFKANNYMDPAKSIEKIQFNSFDNESRMDFFLSFTEGNDIFAFEKALYLDIGPDPGKALPPNIKWLESAKVSELNIDGEVLHEIHFIKDRDLHKYMELCEMEVVYDFSLPLAEGNCKIKFGFHGYFYKRIATIEFVSDILKVNLKDGYSSVSKERVKRALMKEFEIMKSAKYDFIKKKYLAKNYTPN
jgi:hypothetical protein